ncbi:MAG: hypothetical protein JNM74_17430, partial [Myxococcales bacterium]|nr:hypothetical protein [Myxococcales bacterium]
MRRQLFALTLSLGLFAAISPTHAQKPAPGQTAKPKPPIGAGPAAAKPPKVITAAPTKPSLAATSGVRLTARAPD